MAITIKTLSIQQFRQLLRSKSKGRFYGEIVAIAYVWIIAVVIFFITKKDGTSIPALPVFLVSMCATLPDFIMKLVLEHDNTVMDAFLKTRPVSQDVWDRFLAVSHFWKVSNLVMPLAMAPVCFLFLPFLPGLLLFVILYLASVFGGFIVMLVKHKGPYQPEDLVKNRFTSSVRSARSNYISGLQFRSFLRSRRLRAMVIYLGAIMYINCFNYAILNDTVSKDFGSYYVFLFIFLLSCSIPQYGFAVEANFFNGIWSRPIKVEKLLTNKYRFGILCGLAGFVLSLPFCIWGRLSVFDIIASTLFNCCFCNLILLTDSYNCIPFDLFGKSFFNTQGRSTTFKGSTVIIIILTLALGSACIKFLLGWKSQAVLSALGIAGLCAYKPFFRWVVKRFMKNRYKYMEKYTMK